MRSTALVMVCFAGLSAGHVHPAHGQQLFMDTPPGTPPMGDLQMQRGAPPRDLSTFARPDGSFDADAYVNTLDMNSLMQQRSRPVTPGMSDPLEINTCVVCPLCCDPDGDEDDGDGDSGDDNTGFVQ